MLNRAAIPLLLIAANGLCFADQKPRVLTSDDLKSLTWRSVGPANMGGRVADIAFAPGNSKEFFVAFGTGGVWKTTNRGTTLSPVFDGEATASIGSVQICDAPADWKGWSTDTDTEPGKRSEAGKGKIIWVGTGEGNGRNSSSWGNGVYRSTDGGSAWKCLGLEDSKDIPALAADPRNPDVCYVAALGHLWGPNATRGVYKTADGGATWKQVLKIDDETGAVDIKMDPRKPDVLYAAMYHRHRTAWSFDSGGPQGGIYKTEDGGRSWRKLEKGLPKQTGRIGLDVSASAPNVVMAVVESDEGGGRNLDDNRSRRGGVFRSEDGGENWTRVNAQSPRSFYFSKIRIDPNEPKRVYLLGYEIWRSEDGGRTFMSGVSDKLHGDWHAMTIDPSDSDHLLVGSDGGLYQSWDRGATWDFLNTMAAGEFYDVAVDNAEPYHIIGGLQDNGSWLGVSGTQIETGGPTSIGITNGEWRSVGDSDGFHVGIDPTDSNIVYSEGQGGWLSRLNIATGESRNLRPEPREGQNSFRFNWNTPFVISPHDPTVLYMGGNCVFRLTKRGDEWERISPDLTTRDPNKMDTVGSSAETHCTIVSIAESPIEKGRIWTGSDDGLIYVTPDGGANWRNVTPKAVRGFYVAQVTPSHHDRQRAYAAIDGHRSENYDPLVLATDDGGSTWSDITGDLPKGSSARTVFEDVANPDLLFCGTETGAYCTLDRKHWVKLQGLPTVSVQDFVEQPRDMDLVAATHGRSIWIMDDMSALSQLRASMLDKPLVVFQPQPSRPVFRYGLDGMWGDRFFGAKNRESGAKISYWLGAKPSGTVSIKIENAQGEQVATLAGPAEAGLNHVMWDMQLESKRRLPNRGEENPSYAPPGTYKVTVTVGKEKQTTNLVIKSYPLTNDLDGAG